MKVRVPAQWCNLSPKDITNLFLDTGVASNSYSIIELGMVDDLFNDRDNFTPHAVRRSSRYLKFKKGRRENLKKLEDTDADLERVDDLLFEIEKNMKAWKAGQANWRLITRLKKTTKRRAFCWPKWW